MPSSHGRYYTSRKTIIVVPVSLVYFFLDVMGIVSAMVNLGVPLLFTHQWRVDKEATPQVCGTHGTTGQKVLVVRGFPDTPLLCLYRWRIQPTCHRKSARSCTLTTARHR